MKSILSNDKKCLICGSTIGLHRHHIFYGTANRKKSEEDGCWCYLCGVHHNMSSKGVHFNKKNDLKVKRLCQERWEELNGSREEFRKRFGQSYL